MNGDKDASQACAEGGWGEPRCGVHHFVGERSGGTMWCSPWRGRDQRTGFTRVRRLLGWIHPRAIVVRTEACQPTASHTPPTRTASEQAHH